MKIDKVLEILEKHKLHIPSTTFYELKADIVSMEEQEPQISLDTYKQVTKERDIAIEQLHELGYEFGEKIEPTTKNDLALIHTEGLDEEIRCTMCTNSMKSDRGCDGSCVVNKDMYKAVMDAIGKRIQPAAKNDLGVDCISRAYLYNRIKGIDHDEDYECDEFGGSKITYHTCDWDEVLREIENAPSVTPQEPRWIPVSERLPEDHIEVLLNDGDCMSVGYVYYTWDEKLKWHVDCNDEENNFYLNPIAWMPLPDIQIRK